MLASQSHVERRWRCADLQLSYDPHAGGHAEEPKGEALAAATAVAPHELAAESATSYAAVQASSREAVYDLERRRYVYEDGSSAGSG